MRRDGSGPVVDVVDAVDVAVVAVVDDESVGLLLVVPSRCRMQEAGWRRWECRSRSPKVGRSISRRRFIGFR